MPGVIEVPVEQGKLVALIDDDLEQLLRYPWRISIGGYAFRHSEEKILMHRQVFGVVPTGFVIDHINRNRLDNRRDNLRAIPSGANAQNVGAYKNSRSGVRGVFWDASRRKFVAQVRHAGRNHNLGRFDSMEEAKAAVIVGRKRLLPYSIEVNDGK